MKMLNDLVKFIARFLLAGLIFSCELITGNGIIIKVWRGLRIFYVVRIGLRTVLI